MDALVVIVIGVSGSGKSTVGLALADLLDVPFLDGDELHPEANIAKMSAGRPLDDEDRLPWLAALAARVGAMAAAEGGVIACSALKRKYRALIDRRGEGVEFVYLHGSRELIASRLATRHGHFMPTSLLDSQFETLEEPTADEPFIRVEIAGTPEAIADAVLAALGLAA